MKLKTNKALSKRLKITKNKKALIRRGRQDHFNAKETGKATRRKRGMKGVVKPLERMMEVGRKLPYSL